ncbi:MAG: flagellar basal body P-ring protein FlgI [Planctomycetaceae bacterium]
MSLLICGIFLIVSQQVEAAKVADVCRLAGQEEVELMGYGLVAGLSGTGDGGDSATTVRALATALTLMNSPIGVADLRDADNVAVVMITAKVPATGLSRGEHVDCHVISPLGAKSLRGGYLIAAPMENTFVPDDSALAIASGAVIIEDEKNMVHGKIPNGVRLLQDIFPTAGFHPGQESVTLIINKNMASYRTADAIAKKIHSDFNYEVSYSEYEEWIKITDTTITLRIPEIYKRFRNSSSRTSWVSGLKTPAPPPK